MKGLLSLDLNSLTSIPFTHLPLLNIPKNECYVNFGMCGLQLIQKDLLVNNTVEMEYLDLTGIMSSFSICMKSQGSVLEEQFHNQNLGVTWPNNKPRWQENQKVQGQRKKRSNIVLSSCFELGTEVEHASALIWFQNYQKDSCFNPSFTVLQLNVSQVVQQVIHPYSWEEMIQILWVPYSLSWFWGKKKSHKGRPCRTLGNLFRMSANISEISFQGVRKVILEL